MTWLSANGYSSPWRFQHRLDLVAGYSSAPCLLVLLSDALNFSASARRRCFNKKSAGGGLQQYSTPWRKPPALVPVTALDWRESRIGVEFHDVTRDLFWREVVPRLPALRRLYAELGGTVTTITLVRNPSAHILSAWSYLPPLTPDRSQIALGFVEWAQQHAMGLQASYLSASTRYHPRFHPRRGFHSSLASSPVEAVAVLNESLHNVKSFFDVVGILSCLPRFFRSIEAHARLTPIDSPVRFDKRLRAPHGKLIWVATSTGIARRLRNLTAPHAVWPAVRANTSAMEILHQATRLDDTLYAAVAAHEQSHPQQHPVSEGSLPAGPEGPPRGVPGAGICRTSQISQDGSSSTPATQHATAPVPAPTYAIGNARVMKR